MDWRHQVGSGGVPRGALSWRRCNRPRSRRLLPAPYSNVPPLVGLVFARITSAGHTLCLSLPGRCRRTTAGTTGTRPGLLPRVALALIQPASSPLGRVPPIFDAVLAPPGHFFGNLHPLVAKLRLPWLGNLPILLSAHLWGHKYILRP